jgi:GAF domain-containing protein
LSFTDILREVNKETRGLHTLVELADNLVEDFDVIDLLTTLADRCVEVLGVASAGIMLATAPGDLQVLASSSEAMRDLELFEIQSQEGPCLDCHRTGVPVAHPDLTVGDSPWPRFGPQAIAAGYRAVHALPLRLRGTTIGALNLFDTASPGLGDDDLAIAQSFADVATIAVLQDRALLESHRLSTQLQEALTTRIVIEQAKGMVAERRGLTIDAAFEDLRAAARSSSIRLGEFAREIVDGQRSPGTFAPKQVSG